MMFVLRSLIVALGFFGVVYCLLSLLVLCVWRFAYLLCRNSAVSSARILFGLRIFPLLGSAFATLTLALPAFFLLEGGMDEDMGTLLFGAGTVLLFGAGLFRVLITQASVSRQVAEWLEGARPLDADAVALTLEAQYGLPPLVLYGVLTPRVLVSDIAVSLLSPDEMRVAVKHEMEHMRSRDNLKKLILHGAPFPGMGSLERAWQEAAEFAADEAAVSNSDDAVDLAAALIKLCDLVPVQDLPAFTTGLVDMTALVNVRVRRLLAWNEHKGRHARLWLWFAPIFLIALPYAFAHYGQALMITHRATEWFIH